MNRLAKIGLFFLIVGVGGIAYILLAVDQFDRQATYEVTVFMDDAMGLTTNTRVSMAGVPVGTIRSIQLEDGKAKITLAIEENVPIYEDAVVSKQASSLLGTSVISIDPGSRGAASMRDGDTIHTVITRGDFGETLDAAEEAGKEMARVLKEFREELMTEAATQGIAEIIENLRQTSLATRELLDQNLRLLAGTLETIDRFASRVEGQTPDEL
ncbi:MAG: MCE family protein, partial [Spirochaetaceae bacterium]